MRYEERPKGVYDNDLQKLILPTDAEWHDYLAWCREGNQADPNTEVALVQEVPLRRGFDFKAAGEAREQRLLEKEAKTNPILAEILKRR